MYTQHVHVQRGLPRFTNEVWLHRFSSPPLGSPFHPFPLYTLMFSSFLSCPPVFMSGHLILSFVCTHMGPGLSVYVHNLLQPRFQVAQVFIMRWVFIGCPYALGSLSSQPHTPLSRLVPLFMSSFFCLVACTLTLCPTLSASRLPSGGRVCVCVCVTCGVKSSLLEYVLSRGLVDAWMARANEAPSMSS